MALIKCSECGKEVSDKATSCPSCGAPINNSANQKYCKHCGEQIDIECVVCPKCGKQVEELSSSNTEKDIIINNNVSSSASASASASAFVHPVIVGKPKNKWISLLLCIFTVFGHKIYEGKYLMAVLYFFTVGLFGIGWIIDIISILLKPNPYYV